MPDLNPGQSNPEDDGVGFLLEPELQLTHALVNKHFGLVSMFERYKLIGADINISIQPGAGTKVPVRWETNRS